MTNQTRFAKKMRGWKATRPFVPMKPSDLIHRWKFAVGDTVEVIQGEFKGKQGRVAELVKHENKVIVEGVNKQERKLGPHPQMPEGGSVFFEQGIPYSTVRLLDPLSKQPTKVRFVKALNPQTGKMEPTRMAVASGQIIPWPEPEDKYKDQAVGPKDTLESALNQITYRVSMDSPLPNALWNEMYRQKRLHGKESRGL